MCTIVMISGLHPAYGLVVAANRDEYYHRRATGPQVLDHRGARVVGGRDELRAGTWMGATARGFFAGVTNQRTGRPAEEGLRSRGEVVLEALRLGDVDAVEGYVRALDGARYNPFNLAFGDASGVRVAYVRPDAPHVAIERPGPGVHVLANDRLGSAHFPKAGRAARQVEPAVSLPWPALSDALARTLADHEAPDDEALPDPPPGSLMPAALARKLQALCVHTPVYGTVSATMIALTHGAVAHYAYADGPPCRAPFRDETWRFA